MSKEKYYDIIRTVQEEFQIQATSKEEAISKLNNKGREPIRITVLKEKVKLSKNNS